MKLKHLILLAVVLLASFAGLQAKDGESGAIKFDVVYKTTGQGPLKLDLHYPEPPESGAKYPLVIFTHGGGWAAGSKTIGNRGERFRGVSALNEQGFCVASVEYRLCSQGENIRMRDCVTDAKDALRFLAKNAEEFSVDAKHVFTFGDSAGGHLAQMLLLSPPESFPGDPALADAKYRLVAGVSWYGPCDFEKMDLFATSEEHAARDRFGARILKAGAGPDQKLSAYREVSPVNYLGPKSRPLLMIQGDKDTTIPVHHAYHMKERADAVKAPVEILIVENAGHNWTAVGGKLKPSSNEIAAKTASFLKGQLDRSRK